MQRKTTTPGDGAAPIPLDQAAGDDHLALADLLSARVRELLGRAIEEPETLAPGEVRELAASIMFWLASLNGQGLP